MPHGNRRDRPSVARKKQSSGLFFRSGEIPVRVTTCNKSELFRKSKLVRIYCFSRRTNVESADCWGEQSAVFGMIGTSIINLVCRGGKTICAGIRSFDANSLWCKVTFIRICAIISPSEKDVVGCVFCFATTMPIFQRSCKNM